MKSNIYFDLQDVLKLDTILNYLTIEERIIINQYRNDMCKKLPKKAVMLMNYIKDNNVKIDFEFKYNNIRILEWRDINNSNFKPLNTHRLYRAKPIERFGVITKLVKEYQK